MVAVALPLVTTGILGYTVSERVEEPVPPAFVACIEIELEPAVVGVPCITPVEVETDKPAG
jgi:hypothetical protein